MANDNTPMAASVKDIRAAFPKMSDTFVVSCLEKELPIALVATEAANVLQAENESLKTRIEVLEAASQVAADAAETEAQAAEAQAQADLEAKARAAGNKPVGKPSDPSVPTACVRWDSAVAEYRKQGMQPGRAVMAANRANPGLREAMLAEVNAS